MAGRSEEELMKLVESGNGGAEFNIGLMHYFGHTSYGIRIDIKESMKWFSRASSRGDKDAEYFLQILSKPS